VSTRLSIHPAPARDSSTLRETPRHKPKSIFATIFRVMPSTLGVSVDSTYVKAEIGETVPCIFRGAVRQSTGI
jgi:hypothetical protein